MLTLVNGALQVACAWAFGRAWGLTGIAAAGLLTGLLTAVPAATRLLQPATALTLRHMWIELVRPWLGRAAPLLVASALCGVLYREVGVAGGMALGACAGSAYLWHMRPLYVGLPFDPRASRWLVSLRLMPASPAATVEERA